MHPSTLRPPRILRYGFASSACVPRDVHPCTAAEAARSPRRPYGHRGRCRRNVMGPRKRSALPARRSKAEKPCLSRCFALPLFGRAGCASPLGPFTLRRQGTIRPVRVGAGPRRFRWVHGRTFSGTRPLLRTFRAGARKAQCGGVLLFGYFLLHEQEKVTRAAQRHGSLALKVTARPQGEWKPLI